MKRDPYWYIDDNKMSVDPEVSMRSKSLLVYLDARAASFEFNFLCKGDIESAERAVAAGIVFG